MSYRVEYAKSGKAGCRGCGSKIANATTRIGVLVEDEEYGRSYYRWFHVDCFKQQHASEVTSCSQLDGFSRLNKNDQQTLKTKIGGMSSPAAFTTPPVYSPQPSHSPSSLSPQMTRMSPNSGTTTKNELVQLANQFYSSKDAALLAKISTIIYKNCKECCSSVRFNPTTAMGVLTQLASFFAEHHQSLPQDLQMRTCAETIARTCSIVISLSTATPSHSLYSTLQSWRLSKSSAGYAHWIDAQEMINEKKSVNQPTLAQSNRAFCL